MLDGTITAASANIVCTPRRTGGLLPEYMSENLETRASRRRSVTRRIRRGEDFASERFGLWISFYPFAQDDYLAAVGRRSRCSASRHRTEREPTSRQREALQFALQRGSRSGRVAWQFARGYAGAAALRRKSHA